MRSGSLGCKQAPSRRSDSRSVLWRQDVHRRVILICYLTRYLGRVFAEAIDLANLLNLNPFPRPPRLRVHVIGDQQHREQNAGEEACKHAEPNR